MGQSRLVTLLTDFGTRDGYVAAMKGAILRVCPEAQIVDLSHDVPAQDVLTAGFILAQSAPYFPPQTLHVAVVDPGVGTERKILVGRFGEQLFLFPDNGVITFVARTASPGTIVIVQNPEYLTQETVSMTFHGRDIFAPVAGAILNGVDISDLGPRTDSYELLDIPKPVERGDSVTGKVIYVDHFGNLISNIPQELIRDRRKDLAGAHVTCGNRDVGTVRGTYGEVRVGEVLGLFDSMRLLEVAVNCGRACEVLQGGVGTEISLVKK